MFISREIAEITIMTSRKNSSRLASTLLSTNIFHPISVDASFPGDTDITAQKLSFELTSKIRKLNDYMREVGIFLSSGGGSLKIADWIDFSKQLLSKISSLEASVDPIVSALREEKQQATKLVDLLREMEPLCNLDIDLREILDLKLISVKIGEIPSDSIEAAKTFLKDEVFFIWPINDRRSLLVVFSLRENEKNVERILASLGFKQIEIGEGLPSNPMRACEEIRSRLERLELELESRKAELLSYKDRIIELYAEAFTANEAMKILSFSRVTDSFIVVRGFIPSEETVKTRDMLRRALNDEFLLFIGKVERGFTAEEVPSSISVPSFLKPFKMIVDNYGAPKASEIYPVLMVAITFPVIFALMFPDAGHGLLVALFGYFLMRRAKGREGWKNTGLLAIYLGIASVVSGLLAGEFFGPLTNLGEILWHGHPPLPSPFEAGGTAVDIMINISLRLGSTLLILGTFIGMLNYIISRDLIGAIEVGLPKFIAFTFALYPFVIYNSAEAGSIIYRAVFGGAGDLQSFLVRWGSISGLLLMFLAEPIFHVVKHERGSVSSAITMSFMEMFEAVLMMIGNTASFLRILGLSVAHAGLMYSFTVLAKLLMSGTAGIVAGILIYVIGNLLAAGLEGVIVFAHSLRLHYYEWFSKFYSGSGIPFTPLRPLLNIVIE
ncbi:MAG: V-type ATPase 116kDa subunit family protein [Fervidicoccaceae archaeon]